MTSSSGGDPRPGAPFSLGADPIQGESLPGFVMRLAQRVRKQDAGRLAGMVGLRQPGSAVASCDLSDLARRAGTQVSGLAAIAYRPAARLGHNMFLGGVINREFIDLSRRRACPRCLRESMHHRAAWDFTLITACSDHLVRLMDRCPKCRRQLGWRRPNFARCSCNADLTAFPGMPVSGQEAEAMRDLVSLAGSEQVPWMDRRLSECNRADLMRLLMCLGMFLTDWKRERRIETLVSAGADSVAQVVLAGLNVLKRWPGPLHVYLGEQRLLAGQRRGRYGARKTLGAFYDWLTLMEAGSVKTVLAEAAREFVEQDPQLARRVHRSCLVGSDSAPSRVLGLVDAAQRVGRSGETVKRMMAAGMLPIAVSEGRGVPMALDGEAVEVLAARLRDAVPLTGLARMLGVSRGRTRCLVEAGLIRPIQRAGAGGWAQWAFEAAQIESFLERLAGGARTRNSPSQTVAFDYVAEVLRRQGVTLDRMMALILDGSLGIGGMDVNAIGLKRLRFDPALVRALCQGLRSGPTMTIEAAAEQLGLKWQVAAHLVGVGLLEVADGKVPVASVEAFARDYVTGASLAREQRTSPRNLASRLADQGICPVVGPEVDGSRQNIYRLSDLTRTASGQ